MTEPRDPTDPTPDLDPGNAAMSATARMPLPADSPPLGPPPVTAWSPPPAEPVAGPESTDPPPPAWTPAPPPASPAWKPARADDGRGPSLIFGVILLAVGLWFFADHTLGLDLPTLRWSQLWPLILIVIGVWVLFGARRRTR